MHEMALAEGVLEIVESTAQRENARRVKSVILEIGQLSSVEPAALEFCFAAVVSGSLAAGASLEIQMVPGVGWCEPCNENVPLAELYDVCPRCGSPRVQPTAGTENAGQGNRN